MANQPATVASQLRKVKKPLIERRRRERINEYLNELRSLVEDATATKSSQQSKSSVKMEKAEILEMTVRYLRKVHHIHDAISKQTTPYNPTSVSSWLHDIDENNNDVTSTSAAATSLSGAEYVAGFSECARQVRRFLTRNTVSSTRTVGEMSDVICKPEKVENFEHMPCQKTADLSEMLWHHLRENVSCCLRYRKIGTSSQEDQIQLPEKLSTGKSQLRLVSTASSRNSVEGSISQPVIAFYSPNSRRMTVSTSDLSALPVSNHMFPFYSTNSTSSCFSSAIAFKTPPSPLDCCKNDHKDQLNLPFTRDIPNLSCENNVMFSEQQSKAGDGNSSTTSMWRPWSFSMTSSVADSES